MKNTKQIFHVLSYLQYPLMIIAIYFLTKPFYISQSDNPEFTFESINNMLIFLGLGISFSSLQDTNKTSLKFEKKIWKNPKKGKWMLFYMTILSLSTLLFGIFGYFISENEIIEKVAFGSIVLGVGLIGFLKVGIEIFNIHREDRNNGEDKCTTANKS